MSLQWFKFYGAEYLSDPKINTMTPQERSCWFSLLCLASSSSKIGTIEFLTVESLLSISGIKWDPYNTTEWDNNFSVLSKLERMKMIELSDTGIITIVNWDKRQEHNLTIAERVAKSRAKGKNVTMNVTNVTSDKIRLDKIRLDKINTSSLLYLKEIPELDIKEFHERFDCSQSAIKDKAESLYLYCQAKGRIYKNYHAFLLNALKKDFPIRTKNQLNESNKTEKVQIKKGELEKFKPDFLK